MNDPSLLHLHARDVMTRTPVTLPADVRLADAVALMELRRITSVPIVSSEGQLEGVLHIHDLWAAGRS
jgi:arabinose-5-phosphate isomerase